MICYGLVEITATWNLKITTNFRHLYVYNLAYYIIYSISTILSNFLVGCRFLNPSEVPLVLDSLRSSSINLMNLLSASVSPLSQSVNARQFMKEIYLF